MFYLPPSCVFTGLCGFPPFRRAVVILNALAVVVGRSRHSPYKRPLRPAMPRKGLQYGAEMEPPRLPEALRRRPGRQSAAFGTSGGAWALYGEVSGTPPGAPRDASGAFRGAPRTLLETFFEFSAEKTAFLKIELPPTREHGF